MGHIKYVHGYSDREALRLNDQADTLDDIIHNDTIFFKDSLVLEAGCGVGAQTFDKGIKDLYRTAESDGVFSYTFFKGIGKK
jgi:hypothetical protein